MSRQQLRRTFFVLCAVVFLCMVIFTIFALAVHMAVADCCVKTCEPCLILAKFQERLRQLGVMLVISVGILVLLTGISFAAGEFWRVQNMHSPIFLKTKLNN